jgi:RNA polymerase sigma-70 factor, ECF subfamily
MSHPFTPVPAPNASTPVVPGDLIATHLLQAMPQLRRLARALTRNAADAEDLVQTTCVRVLERREGLAHADKLCGWILRVMKNINIDLARRPGRKATPYFEDVLPASVPQPIAPWRWVSDEDLAASVRQLSPACRAAWELGEAQAMNYRDVARKLNVASATVGTRVHRARGALRRMLTSPRIEAGPQ